MTDREALEGVVNRLYEARAVNDLETMMGFAGPEFSFCLAASGKLAPLAQRGCAPAELNATLRMLVDQWDMSRMRTTRLYVDGDTVLAHREGVLRFNPTGREIETEYIDRFTFRDGKIVDLTEYVDTLLVAETLGLVEA